MSDEKEKVEIVIKFIETCAICGGLGRVRILESPHAAGAVVNLNTASIKNLSDEQTCPECQGRKVTVIPELERALKIAGVSVPHMGDCYSRVGTYEDCNILEKW